MIDLEDLDLIKLLEYYKHKKLFLFMFTLFISSIVFTGMVIYQKPLYRTYTTVILGGSGEETVSLTQSDVTLNKNLLDTYAEVVKSRRVLEQVIQNLGLNMSYDSFGRKVSVSAVNDTEIIKIVVVDKNPSTCQRIADETAIVFTNEIISLYKLGNVHVLDKAVKPVSPYNIHYKKTIIIAFIIGMVVSFGIVFLMYYFDRTIKSVEMVEEITGLPILGSVQFVDDSKRRKR